MPVPLEKIKVDVNDSCGSVEFQVTIQLGHGPADLVFPHGPFGETREFSYEDFEKMFIYQTNFSKSFQFPGIMGNPLQVSLGSESASECKLSVCQKRMDGLVADFLLWDMKVSVMNQARNIKLLETRLVNVNTEEKTQTFDIHNFVTTDLINNLEARGGDLIQVEYNQHRAEKTVNLVLCLEFTLNPEYIKYYKEHFIEVKKSKSSGQIKTLAELESELKLMTLGSLLEQNKEYSDFKIVVGENPEQVTFDVHKLVLASQSEYFAGLFRSNCQEMIDGFLQLKDVNVEKFNVILKFLYHGSFKGCKVDSKDLGEYYRLADRFGIKKLELYCKIKILHLEDNFDGKFALELLELAISLGTESFLDSILELIKPLYPEIKKLEKWDQFIDLPENMKVIKKLLFMLE